MPDMDTIIGHERPRKMLRRALDADRLHHAYLFTGPEGVGKRLTAMAMASTITCEGHDDFDSCRTCQMVEAGQHPDVLVIAPDRSKARPVIKIDAIRALKSHVPYKPYMAERRVVVIDDADTMGDEASNALLKTLEEPSGETSFILVTARPAALLPTIRSRCQAVRFGALSVTQVANWLQQRGVEQQRAEIVAGYSDGSLSRAAELSDEGVLDGLRELIVRIVSVDEDPRTLMTAAADIAGQSNEALRAMLWALLVLYRDALLLRTGASPARIANRDLMPTVRELSERVTTPALIQQIEQIGAVDTSLTAYVDARMLMENLLFDARM